MCGIAGYILNARAAGTSSSLLRSLLSGVRGRGPDDEGACLIDRGAAHETRIALYLTDRTDSRVVQRAGTLGGVLPGHDAAFVNTRFAIIDPSPGGHQPFLSQDGSCVVVVNGEIYNYLELRKELAADGIVCRTDSDTEVLVEGWRRWGHGLWPKLNGFWAAAVYDSLSNTVVLCRDRLGVAPLYYRVLPDGLYFSSLIDPLIAVAPGGDVLDLDAVHGFLATGLKDHDGTTMYRHIHSLPPAMAFTFSPGRRAAIEEAEAFAYWALPDQPLSVKDISLDEAALELRGLFNDAVRLRLRSDVPLAFELSGGLDSSSVVAAAAAMWDRKLTAYTIRVRGRDESPFARAVAKRFNIDHRIFTDMEEGLPRDAQAFARVMEEPYDTPANYVHHRMLKAIKADGFRVILTGAGGDEALAGYEVDLWPAAWRALRRQGLAGACQGEWYEFCRRFRTGPEAWHTLAGYMQAFKRLAGQQLSGQDESLVAASRADAYMKVFRQSNFYAQRLFHCRVGLLPYYLRSTDHYTMSIPIEHRFPFLDYRLVELGMKMPVSYLFRGGWNKYLLRRAMGADLPSSVLWRRKKMGFPFDFAGYFPQRRRVFEPYLKELEPVGVTRVDYAVLAAAQPARLWRMLSAGIWLGGLKQAGAR